MRIVRFKYLIVFLFLMLTIFDTSFVASFTTGEGRTSDILPSHPPRLGVNAEQDNVDSFNVHPNSGRWSEIIAGGGFSSITVNNGFLNFTDVGDGTDDQHLFRRGFKSLDDSVNVRFLFDSDSASVDGRNLIQFIIDGETSDSEMDFRASSITDGSVATPILSYDDINGASQALSLTGDERLSDDTWYLLRIKFNIFQSELEWRVKFDNGSTVFSHKWQDISSVQPELFSRQKATILVGVRSFSNGATFKHLVDYVEAPFKENEWVQQTSSADADFRQQSWEFYEARGVVNDEASFALIVPLFDSVSGKMVTLPSITFTAGDFSVSEFTLQGIDGDDGGIHSIMTIRIHYTNIIFPTVLFVDGLAAIPYAVASPAGPASEATVQFSFALTEDRTKVQMKANVDTDASGAVVPQQIVWEGLVSTYVTDPSSEFRLLTRMDIQLDNAGDDMNYALQDFGFQSRDIFADIVQPIVDGIFAFLAWIWMEISRFLGAIFAVVGILIVFAIETLESALETALTALGVLLEAAIEALEPFLTVISNAVDALWTLFIATLSDIVDELIVLASGFVTFFFDVLEVLIPLLVTFLGTILGSVVTLLANLLFTFWDALGFPNLLAILDLTLTHTGNFITELVAALTDVIQFLIDVSWIPLVVWWAYAVPFQFAKAAFEPLAGLGNTIEVYFQNLTPVSVLGFRLYFPIGVFATVWLIVLLPADFIGFTALP